jgi:hypothetical protein
MSRNQSRDPLFYIIQPEITLPKGNMQEKFIVKKTEQGQETPISEGNSTLIQDDDKSIVKEEEKSIKQSNSLETNFLEEKEIQSADVQDVINEYNEKFETEEAKESKLFTTRKQHSYTMKRLKSFIEMNKLERISYLLNFPRQLPPVPCVFVTKTSSVRGFLIDKTEDAIEIKQFNDKTMEILIDDLVSIKMIGLK